MASILRFAAAVVVSVVAAGWGRAEPIVPHPAAALAGTNGWNIQLGQFGESLVREVHRAKGEQAFNLNVSGHGIDGLVRAVKPDGSVEYRVIEVKTLQHGTDFQLNDTKNGKQLSTAWIEDRLATAAKSHQDPATRQAAEEALTQFRKNPAAMRAELHGVSVGENQYVVKRVDPVTAAIKEEVCSGRVSVRLEELSKQADNVEVRRAAARHLADYEQLQTAVKPRVVKDGADIARQMGGLAGVEEKQMHAALKEASEQIRNPGQSRWVKAGGKVVKFAGKVAGPGGVVIGAVVYSAEAADVEQRFERGELTREQADAEQAKLATHTAATTGGGLAGLAAGAAIGTFVCPGPGTFIGGIVGGVVGCVGADLVMAATRLDDVLAEHLRPGAEAIRLGCAFVKDKGIAITIATQEQVREWIGAETYDQTAAALNSAAAWTGGKVEQAAMAVKDAAVLVKDKTVEGLASAGEAVSDAADWSQRKAQKGWGYLRRQFE